MTDSSSITIDGIKFENYTEKEPDFKTGNLDNFKFYYKIFPENYKDIALNTVISYQLKNNKYNTGSLLKFIEPNIFILKDSRYYYIWSIVINNENSIYVKDIKHHRRENMIKDKLFEMYINNNNNNL